MDITLRVPVEEALIHRLWVDRRYLEDLASDYISRYIKAKMALKKIDEFRQKNPDLLMEEEEILEMIEEIDKNA